MHMVIHNVVRSRIRAERLRSGIEIADLAEKLGMSERNYQRIETGEAKTLDVGLLSEIAKELGVDLSDFFSGEISISNNEVVSLMNKEVNVLTISTEVKGLLDSQQALIKAQHEIIEHQRQLIDQLKIK